MVQNKTFNASLFPLYSATIFGKSIKRFHVSTKSLATVNGSGIGYIKPIYIIITPLELFKGIFPGYLNPSDSEFISMLAENGFIPHGNYTVTIRVSHFGDFPDIMAPECIKFTLDGFCSFLSLMSDAGDIICRLTGLPLESPDSGIERIILTFHAN